MLPKRSHLNSRAVWTETPAQTISLIQNQQGSPSKNLLVKAGATTKSAEVLNVSNKQHRPPTLNAGHKPCATDFLGVS